MEDRLEVENVNIYAVKRQHSDGKTYNNIYVEIDGHKFEVVPRVWTIKEKAYFYSLLDKNVVATK